MINVRSKRRGSSKKNVRGVLRRAPHRSRSKGSRLEPLAEADEEAGAKSADAYRDYLNERSEVDDLASRVCALATTPAAPHYFVDGDEFAADYSDDEDECYSDDDARYEGDEGDNSLLLASRTSKIMSNYEDFISGMDTGTRYSDNLGGQNTSTSTRYSDNPDGTSDGGGKVIGRAEDDKARDTFGDPATGDGESPFHYDVRRSSLDLDTTNLHDTRLMHQIRQDAGELLRRGDPGPESVNFFWRRNGYHYAVSKKVIWGVLGLVVVVIGVVTGISVNRTNGGKETGEDITPVVIGMNPPHEEETIQAPGHTFEEFDAVESKSYIVAATTIAATTKVTTTTATTTEGSTAEKAADETTSEMSSAANEVESPTSIPKTESQPDVKPIEVATGWGNQPVNLDYTSIIEKYSPLRFDRSEGWDGKSYTDAIAFCASRDMTLCPYEAVCPSGEGGPPIEGYVPKEKSWAALLDRPNDWVQIGNLQRESCKRYDSVEKHPPLWGLIGGGLSIDGGVNDKTPYVVCCSCKEVDGMFDPPEPSSVAVAKTTFEQAAMDQYHPVWFTREHGYKGTTHQASAAFCASMAMQLCPIDVICPSEKDGSGTKKLFLHREPFGSEQWAPVRPMHGKYHTWVSVGREPRTCLSYEEAHGKSPEFGTDGSWPELKEHVLCCQDTQYLARERKILKQFNPIWIESSSLGWDGGSHEDAERFCQGLNFKKLCPYEAYCPHGPSRPVLGGHATDFNTEGEQWAPVYHGPEKWVQIGQKWGNVATTCLVESELPTPVWGNMTNARDAKRHIMCCSY